MLNSYETKFKKRRSRTKRGRNGKNSGLSNYETWFIDEKTSTFRLSSPRTKPHLKFTNLPPEPIYSFAKKPSYQRGRQSTISQNDSETTFEPPKCSMGLAITNLFVSEMGENPCSINSQQHRKKKKKIKSKFFWGYGANYALDISFISHQVISFKHRKLNQKKTNLTLEYEWKKKYFS